MASNAKFKMFSVSGHWEPLTLIAMFSLKIRIRWIQVIGVRDTNGVRGKKTYDVILSKCVALLA